MIRGKRKPITSEQALQRLEELCATAEVCSGEARDKLKRWGFSSEDIENIIVSLTDRKFIDNRRFALAYAHDKFFFGGWGRIKIGIQLQGKKIPQDIIREAVESIDESQYRERLHDQIKRETNRHADDISDFAVKQKIARRFMSRGFEPSLVIAVLKEILR